MLPPLIKVSDLSIFGGLDVGGLSIAFDSLIKKQNISNITNLYIQFGTQPKLFIQGQQAASSPTEALPQQNDHQYGNLPFGMGVHFVINQRSWWEQERPLADRIVGQVKFVPIKLNRKEDIALLDNEPRSSFSVRSTFDGNLEVKLPPRSKDKSENKSVVVSRSNTKLSESAGTKWIFHRYKPDEFMKLHALEGAILSFDEKLVKTAWLAERSREREIHQQYYVLIVASST